MKVLQVKQYDREVLIKKLRLVTLMEDVNVCVYEDSYISLEMVCPKILVPPQNYLLSKELKEKEELYYAFMEAGIDIFNLDGYVEFMLEDNVVRTLLPPIVEESIEDNGEIVPLINDGMHRVYYGKIRRRLMQVVYIRGIKSGYPYYAYPVIGGWDSVKLVDELDVDVVKKWHRIRDNKKLYRNFDSVFVNCSKPRMIDFSQVVSK